MAGPKRAKLLGDGNKPKLKRSGKNRAEPIHVIPYADSARSIFAYERNSVKDPHFTKSRADNKDARQEKP